LELRDCADRNVCRVLGLNDREADIEEAAQESKCRIQRFARLAQTSRLQ